MKNLSEENVAQLAMSPLYVLYLVASEYIRPEQISERHIVRSVEYGLKSHMPFSEGIFDLLRSNLHEFYADLPKDYSEQGRGHWRTELLAVKEVLNNISGSSALVDDFKETLANLARFVAEGGAFRQKLQNKAMSEQAEWVKCILG